MPNGPSRATVKSKWRAENANSVKAHEKQEISLGTILFGLAVSMVLIVLGYTFSGPTWEDITFCYKTLSEGTEANALILERDTSTRLLGGRRRSPSSLNRSSMRVVHCSLALLQVRLIRER